MTYGVFKLVKPGLHIIVTIAEHASDEVPNRFLKAVNTPLQILLVKYEYLRSLQLCNDLKYVGT